jgi:hypothetical protein
MIRQLLKDWLKTVKWDHTGAFGITIALTCPYCDQLSERVDNSPHSPRPDIATIKHTNKCLVFRTMNALKKDLV